MIALTEADTLALYCAVIASVTGVIIAIINNKKSDRKIDHITVLTNSTLTAATKRIEALELQVQELLLRLSEKTHNE